jgi:hypothetical protein
MRTIEAIFVQIIDYRETPETLKQFAHLCEYQVRPEGLPDGPQNFKRRDGFVAGRLMIGDLIINEEFSRQLEVHPFPEWVAQLVRLDTDQPSVDGYCVFLNVPEKDFHKIEKKDWRERKDGIKELVKVCTEGSMVAFRMVPGICVKVDPNAPHYFISAAKPDDAEYPYCQVYEPEIDWATLAPFGKLEPTAYFSVSFDMRV